MLASWSSIQVAGKTVEIFEPPNKPRYAVLFLHDLDQQTLAKNPVYTAELTKRNLACLCPHGHQSWWLDRVAVDFDPQIAAETWLVEHVAPFANERWQFRRGLLGVFGVGMGGQGALRVAFRHPKIFPAAAGIAAALDFHEAYGSGQSLDAMYDSKEHARQDTALMHLPPYDPPPHLFFAIDPEDHDWYRGNDRLHEKMNALGGAHTVDFETSAGGHSWDYFNRMAEPTVRFLTEALDKESRRLL